MALNSYFLGNLISDSPPDLVGGIEICHINELNLNGSSCSNVRTINLKGNGYVIDATDCGDVAVAAGADFTFGREDWSTYGETLAGELYWNFEHLENENIKRFWFENPGGIPGTTHRGDVGTAEPKTQAYSYLMTIEEDTCNESGQPASLCINDKPPGYLEETYDSNQRFVDTWPFRSGFIPCSSRDDCRKWEVNVHPKGSDLQEANYDYPKGSPTSVEERVANIKRRREIEQEYRTHALGYLYYLRHDQSSASKEHDNGPRNSGLGLASDEFEEIQFKIESFGMTNFPSRIYARECRRIEGRYIFKERDATPYYMLPRSNPLVPTETLNLGDSCPTREDDQLGGVFWYRNPEVFQNYVAEYELQGVYVNAARQRPPVFEDSIGLVSYAMDSHAVKEEINFDPATVKHAGEGEFFTPRLTGPGHIPFRILVPGRGAKNLLVSHAVSASHVGYGTLRMEPARMSMGQAAGVAASLASNLNLTMEDIFENRSTYVDFIRSVQRELLKCIKVNDNDHTFCQKLFLYRDVDTDQWYWAHEAIQFLSLWGIVEGLENYDFKPAQSISRAEFLKISTLLNARRTSADPAIVRKEKERLAHGGGECASTFADMNVQGEGGTTQGHWSCKYVNEAHARGGVNGYKISDSTFEFRPDNLIIRAELVKLIVDSFELCPAEESLQDNLGEVFEDITECPVGSSKEEHWYCRPLACAYKKGVVKGRVRDGGLFFDPAAEATRAEATVALYRAYNQAVGALASN